MHPYHQAPPYQPPEFAPSADVRAPIQLPVDLTAAQLADELHAQLSRVVGGRDLRVLRRQARSDFRAVMRHVRARRLDGKHRAPLAILRAGPGRGVVAPRQRRRRHPP